MATLGKLQQQLLGAVSCRRVPNDFRVPQIEPFRQADTERFGEVGHIFPRPGTTLKEPAAKLLGAESRRSDLCQQGVELFTKIL